MVSVNTFELQVSPAFKIFQDDHQNLRMQELLGCSGRYLVYQLHIFKIFFI